MGVKITRGNCLGPFCQPTQGLQLAGDNTHEHVEHQQQTYNDDGHDGTAQTVEAAEDVIFRTDDGHRAACLTKWFVEHIAIRPIDVHVLHAFLATLHGMTQGDKSRVGLFHGLGKDGLTGDLGGVRMHKIGSATPDHDTVGVGIGLNSRDSLR